MKKGVKIFLFLVLPLIASILLHNPLRAVPIEKINLIENGTETNWLKIPKEEFEPNAINLLRNVFNIPFDLQLYSVCFLNGDSSKDSQIYKSNTMIVKLSEKKNLTVNQFGKNCTEIYADELFLNQQTHNIRFVIKGRDLGDSQQFQKEKYIYTLFSQSEISLLSDSYARPEFWSSVIKIILTYVSILALILLSLEVKSHVFDT